MPMIVRIIGHSVLCSSRKTCIFQSQMLIPMVLGIFGLPDEQA